MRSGVRERSAKAVETAGTRERRAPVASAGKWAGPGIKPEGETFRPGKTKVERRRA